MKLVYEEISAAINAAIKSDSANPVFLQSLGSITLAIETEVPAFAFQISLNNGKIAVSELIGDQPIDIHIKGKVSNLLRLLIDGFDDAAALRKADIRVEGDVSLLLELSQIMGRIEIDWEAMLAEKIGETPAVMLCRGARIARTESGQALDKGQGLIKEWLESPVSPLPPRAEYNQLKTDLRDLQYRIDRANALLNQT